MIDLVEVAFEARPSELVRFVRQVMSAVPWHLWQHRINGLSSLLKANPIWEPYLLEHHGLEFAFGSARQHFRSTGRYPWPPRTAEEYQLYSFLAVAASALSHLTPAAQLRFVGSIKQGLEKEVGLNPIGFELRTVAHLAAMGFKIGFHDLESGGGYDFLASAEGDQIEVECKYISGDLGRKIHLRTVVALGGLLSPILARDVERSTCGRLTRIRLVDRLSANLDDQRALAQQIDGVLSGRAHDGPADASVVEFPLNGSPFDRKVLSSDVIRAYVGRAHGIHNANIVAQWRPLKSASVVTIASAKPDSVTASMLRLLKGDAKRQFSGTLPGLMCVQLADLTESQLQDIADTEHGGTPTALQRIASLVLEGRPHLHSIAFTVGGEVKHIASPTGRESVRETSKSYVFKNPNHPSANSAHLARLFR